MPPLLSLSPSSLTSSLDPLPSSFLLTTLKIGDVSNPSLITSLAFSWNFAEDNSIKAWLFPSMYLSSLTGKLDDKGTAIQLLPITESSVTVCDQPDIYEPEHRLLRTHIVISVFYKESHPFAVHFLFPSRVPYIISRVCDISKELSVGKSPARLAVYNGGALRFVPSDGLEDRYSW